MATAPRKPQDRKAPVKRANPKFDLDLDALEFEDEAGKIPFSVQIGGTSVVLKGLEDVDPRYVMSLDQIDESDRLASLRAAVDLLEAALEDKSQVDLLMGIGMRKISVLIESYMKHNGAPLQGEGDGSSTS